MATLRVMASLVRERSGLVEDVARWIASGNPDPDDFPEELSRWLRRHVVQEPDPFQVELLRSPEWSLAIIMERGTVAGDCDDLSTLAAALARAAGLEVRFVVLAWGQEFSHVFTEVLAPGAKVWYSMDVHRGEVAGLPAPTREVMFYPA